MANILFASYPSLYHDFYDYLCEKYMAKTAGRIINDPVIGEVLLKKSTKARRVSIRVPS